MRVKLFLAFILCLSSTGLCGRFEPKAVYLTWQHDPCTTMTVQWLSDLTQESNDLWYQKEGQEEWHIALGNHSPLPKKMPYLLHRVELTGLTPGTTYHFKTGNWDNATHKFNTLSGKPAEELRFVVGGDMYHDEIEPLVEMHHQAAKHDPHFALVGGDIAYASTSKVGQSSPEDGRWIEWLAAWNKHMVTPSGFMIPFIPAIGNHDTNGRFRQTPKEAPFFYALFPFPGEAGCNVLDCGESLSIFVLDTHHTHPVEGKQAAWLEAALNERKLVKDKFALYHVPAYPSVRKFKGIKHTAIRKHWVPLFEQGGITACFENHEHTYKRSYLLKGGKIDPAGILYLGDGAYGVKNPRVPKNLKRERYLATASARRHFILVTLKNGQRLYQAIDSQGKVFDEYKH